MDGRSFTGGAIALGMALMAACGGGDASTSDTAATGASTATSAAGTSTAAPATSPGGVRVSMIDANGNELGTLTLSDAEGGRIAVAGTLRGLPPGEHGMHLHMTGICAPPFESAGHHWNPAGRKHGTLSPEGPHAGDLPNIMAGADGTATVSGTSAGGPLRGAGGFVDADGGAVMIHATTDDYKTDPSGGSGAKIACGAVAAGS